MATMVTQTSEMKMYTILGVGFPYFSRGAPINANNLGVPKIIAATAENESWKDGDSMTIGSNRRISNAAPERVETGE